MQSDIKPIKRQEFLQPLSRDHHHGLLLCWKIKTGLKKNIDLRRISDYCRFFYDQHLQPHFQIEEKEIFPILGYDSESVKKAVQDHLELTKLFNQLKDNKKILELIEVKLNEHIRFEERVLFNEIQEKVNESELQKILNLEKYERAETECWADRFWI